jgi:hypothetical protein
LQACGDVASSIENVCCVWEESHDAFAKRTPDFASSATCSGDFSAIFVASAATFHFFRHCHRLVMDRRHRFHGRPCQRVLALLGLLQPVREALSAGFRSGSFRLCSIGRRQVLAAAFDA